jgi:hypothetical protein
MLSQISAWLISPGTSATFQKQQLYEHDETTMHFVIYATLHLVQLIHQLLFYYHQTYNFDDGLVHQGIGGKYIVPLSVQHMCKEQ